jgi:hypothetical protein
MDKANFARRILDSNTVEGNLNEEMDNIHYFNTAHHHFKQYGSDHPLSHFLGQMAYSYWHYQTASFTQQSSPPLSSRLAIPCPYFCSSFQNESKQVSSLSCPWSTSLSDPK